MNGVQIKAAPEGVPGWTLRSGRIDDPDLDDPSARARLSSLETCGRVTPRSSAISFCVWPSS
jgi:hypothetical protein